MTTLRELSKSTDYRVMKDAFDQGGRHAAGTVLCDMLCDGDRDWEATTPVLLVKMCFLATDRRAEAARIKA